MGNNVIKATTIGNNANIALLNLQDRRSTMTNTRTNTETNNSRYYNDYMGNNVINVSTVGNGANIALLLQ